MWLRTVLFVTYGQAFMALLHPSSKRSDVSQVNRGNKKGESLEASTSNLSFSDPFSSQSAPRNLKKTPDTSTDKTFLNSWKEMSGLSEKELLISAALPEVDRSSKAITLAYRRCEHITQLFSKTFYIGTSLMPAEARPHVWAIYAWCRRTDDLVDSPRACLLNRENLDTDLKLWTQRLDDIWMGKPTDLFDLAMVDTLKKYPDLSITPFRDMIKGVKLL